MDDFAGSCGPPDMDENRTRWSITSEKRADVTSPYAISSSVLEATKNDDDEFKKLLPSHGEVLEKSGKLIISCGNPSNENATIEQKVSCNRVATLQGGENDADCTRSKYCRFGMHEDLLFDIMLWLPVTSLLRFRSVCRLWCSLIDSSAFITQHYNHNSNKNCLLAHHVVSSYADYDSNFCLLSGNMYEVYSNLDYEQPWHSVNEITILNSCNGIVSLLNEKSGDVALWNPATKQLRPLPESSSMSHQRQTDVKFGFGFDAKSNDYKVVKITYHYGNKHNNLVEVYNLRTDSWRTIHKDDVLPFQSIDSGRTIFKNAACFWIGWSHSNEVSLILISFDLNNEVFETMLLPVEHDLYHYNDYYTSLGLLSDKLCFIMGMDEFDGNDTYCEIWMLGECGVKESWKKICKLKPAGSLKGDLPYVIGFSKNGEYILLSYEYDYNELYLSNVDGREERNIEIHGPMRLPIPNHVLSKFVSYNESLVSFKREDDDTNKLIRAERLLKS